MSCLYYRGNTLYVEDVSVPSLAEKYGTPVYAYSKKALSSNWHAFDQAFAGMSHLVCYAVKANSNLAILQLFANMGSGFDIVSGGELNRVLRAGGDPQKIIFSGVGKKEVEMEQAIAANIYCFNIESEAELSRLNGIATRMSKRVNIAFRVNPNIDPQTHPHIATGLKHNKFGVDIENVVAISEKLKDFPALNLIGLACHIGSQITELEPFLLAIDSLFAVYRSLKEKGFVLEHFDLGGGLGITYHNEKPPNIKEYVQALEAHVEKCPVKIMIEPGRAIVGNAGALITRVEYVKHNKYKNFAIVDAGMNDLLRPALYNAWQNILPVEKNNLPTKLYDVAGPVCESADIFGKDRDLAIQEHDLLAIDSCGAYSFSMSSNYNSRCRAPEILVDEQQSYIIRRRETVDELYEMENLL